MTGSKGLSPRQTMTGRVKGREEECSAGTEDRNVVLEWMVSVFVVVADAVVGL